MRTVRHTALSLLFAAALSGLGLATSGCAGGRVGIALAVGIPPPPLRAEVILASPGPGFVWVPGYWDWAGASYVWVAGAWVRPPFLHARWESPRWRRHHYYRGRWHH